MMRKVRFYFISVLMPLLVIAISCSKDNVENNSEKEVDGFRVSTDSADLQSRIENKNINIELEDVDSSEVLRSSSSSSCFGSIEFKLRANVLPPIYEGDTLQASHVIIKDNFAFVTYNTQGEKYRGGVELFDVSNLDNPKIVWSAILPEGDISAADYYDGILYLAGAQNLDHDISGLEKPAFLDMINLNDKMEMEGRDTILNLFSYAGTDVRVENNRIYATSGSNGYFKVFDFNYKEIYSEQIDHARSVDFSSKYVCVLQAEPGNVKKYNRSSLSFYFNIATGGAEIPGSKSELVVMDSYFITALNEGGVRAMDYGKNEKFAIAKPETPEGKNPENYVSNSISVNDKILFIANGGAGIYVVCLAENPVRILGTMHLEEKSSVNFVESKGCVLFAATGKGGLKIVEMIKK